MDTMKIVENTRCHPGPCLRATIGQAWKALRELFSSYHPERHYMRGPGPKWRERHAAASSARQNYQRHRPPEKSPLRPGLLIAARTCRS